MMNASPGFRNFSETGAIFLPKKERLGRIQKKKVRSGSQKAAKGRTAHRLYGFRKKVGRPVWFTNGVEKSDRKSGRRRGTGKKTVRRDGQTDGREEGAARRRRFALSGGWNGWLFLRV